MRCSVTIGIALTLLAQVEGYRVSLTMDDLEAAKREDEEDPLDDFLDGVSSPTVPERRPNDPVGNPVLTTGTEDEQLHAAGQEKILRLEEVAERESEDYEEMKIEEICVEAQHAREETDYEAEQLEVLAEKKNVAKGATTEPYHKCDPIWGTHRSIYPTFFRTLSERYSAPSSTTRSSKRPMFPERLGEFVIQEVRHVEPEKGSHVMLSFRGCASCENEVTTTMDWGGLVPVNEDGEYHARKTGDRSEQVIKVRSSYECLKTQNACKADSTYHSWADPGNMMGTKVGKSGTPMRETIKDKYVERATYMFSSFKGDTTIEPLLEEAAFGNKTLKRDKLNEIGIELRHEEKHVPFNHELEQLHIDLFTCTEAGSKLNCANAHELLVIHDGAILGGSTQTSMLDQLGDKDSCTFGVCGTGSFMTECVPGQCRSPEVFNRYMRQSDLCYASQVQGMTLTADKSGRTPSQIPFSCIKERTSGVDTPIQSGSIQNEGLFFRTGTASKAHVTGHMQWHVTVPTPGTCVPELGDSFYIGMGVSEADPCVGTDGPDLDLGVIFYSCKGGSAQGMKVSNPASCEVLNYRTWGSWYKQNAIAQWAQYSGDNQDGSGGGDDEWFFIRLDAMRQLGVTHIAITTHVYGCTGHPNTEVAFSQLEGAFMRFASGPTDKENFHGSETFAYLDVDVSMAKTDKKGAVMAVLFLESPTNHPLPTSHREFVERGRVDEAHDHGVRWQVGFLADPIRSSGGFNMKGQGVIHQISQQVFGNREVSDTERVVNADPLAKMHTGHPETLDNPPVANVLESLATQQTGNFESEDHTDHAHATQAREMPQEHFYEHFSYTFESGHPGTSLFCFA